MNKISLCMIVKNEENYIGNCLKSVCDIVDEIIIVDTGSTDKTKEICKKYTDKIYDYKWINDFSDARNFSFSKATCDYLMWLDADDILKEEDRNKFKKLKEELPNIKNDFIAMEYNYSFDANGNPQLTFRRNRIVKKSINPVWKGFIHEIIDININDAYQSDIVVTHTKNHNIGDRNLKIFEIKKNEGVEFTSRDTLYYAKELYYNARYVDAIIEFKKFLSQDVWIEDRIDALIKVSECYKLLQNDENFIKKLKENNTTVNDERRKILFESFKLTHPRAEVLYRIASSYVEEERFYEAIYYLESILTAHFPENCAGFLNLEMWNFLPYLQLCYCYFCIGDVEKSKYYHSKCLEIRPEHPSVIYNQQYFEKM